MRLSMNVERLRLWALLAPQAVVLASAKAALAKCYECCCAHLDDEEAEAKEQAKAGLRVQPFKPLGVGEGTDNPGMDASTVLDWIKRNDFLDAPEEHAVALMGLAAIAPKAPLPEVEAEEELVADEVDAEEHTIEDEEPPHLQGDKPEGGDEPKPAAKKKAAKKKAAKKSD